MKCRYEILTEGRFLRYSLSEVSLFIDYMSNEKCTRNYVLVCS
jgi:hypothetical protein